MSRFWSESVRKIKPYIPGEQPKNQRIIKLNTNESPYPPSPKVMEAMRQAVNEDLRLYPDPGCDELRNTIARYYRLKKDQVFVGNGSDEVLAFAFQAFFNPGSPILFPDITYSFYPVYAALFNLDYRTVPLDKEFSVPVKLFFEKNGGIVIPNPNAPTSKYMRLESICDILEHNRQSVVIVDEAYIDFGGDSAVTMIDQYPNLLVVQTFSKSRSLAGLRIGFAMGDKDLVEGLGRIRDSFNSYTVDRLAAVGAREAINDEAYFQETRLKIMRTRDRVAEELIQSGFKVLDSKANFIFISHPILSARKLFTELRENGILVRYFDKPGTDNFLRVSIGSDEEMDCFLKMIRSLIH